MHFNIPTLFLKLDFEKAFNRMEHEYIWAVLTKKGLGGTILLLAKGLLARAVSKVHVNGHFTQEIPITRGVRQGFPLSLLIFALSTQPLMGYLEEKLNTRDMDGIKISNSLTICHRLFADDVGIFIPAIEAKFTKLQNILQLYEKAFRAKLNTAKSVVIPLAILVILQWLINTSCSISPPGEVQKCMGAPFGLNLKSSQIHDFCLDHISKRIKGWENRLLSFVGRILLIEHVLQSISIYHMMYMETPTNITKHINRMFKEFLWGFSKDGTTRKVLLISWKWLTHPQEAGGLCLKDFFTHAQALLSKWISRALDDPST